MSLIKCNECGKEISTLAETCPNCGAPIEKENLEAVELSGNEVENTETKTNSIRNNKKLMMICIPILIIVLGFGVFFGIKAYKDKVSADNLKKCKTELNKYHYDALLIAAECEKTCNLINEVWSNSIYKENDKKTNKYTKNKSGVFYEDFNDALKSLQNSSKYTTLTDKINEAKEKLDKKYRKIKEYESKLNEKGKNEVSESMKALKELHEQVEIFSNLATNPSGSLTSYSSNVSKVDQDCMTKYSMLKNSL